MSICRRTWARGIYIYEMATDTPAYFHCQICPLSPTGGDWMGRGRWRLTLHVLRHVWMDRHVPVWSMLMNVWWYRS